ncbi:lytic transglycosylase domain-containing protein [Amycolatopsis thermoflava]|uniref:lytic transglycosylase domain-containing protein n=1 Tax=Amycolatopsis thermoflava TaxID=84480 RepID=UPI00040DEC64|nr:hypothetical protein [Amycolatopsis thermoflava]
MADLSFNIVALDKAGATFVKLAEQAERLSDKLDKIDGRDATATVNVRTDQSDKALDSFSNRFALLAAGITAASPAVGAAILGGVGAGFIGVGALALKSNQDVQQAYSSMWSNVVSTSKAASAQLVPQFVSAANAMNAEVTKLGPAISRAMSFAGPDIVALTRGINTLADNAMPGLNAAMANSLPVFQGVAGAMGILGTSFSNNMTSMSANATNYGLVVQSTASIVDSALTAAVGIVNTLATAWGRNSTSINSAVSSVGASISGLAQGTLPVLSAALGAASGVLNAIASVLAPIAPLLGGVGAAALATWAAFKLAGAVQAGVQALAMGVLNLGVRMETAGAASARMITGLGGVSGASATAAAGVTAAGNAAAGASLRFAAAASAMAGPLSIALVAGTLLLGLLGSSFGSASGGAKDLSTSLDGVTSALQSSHGAFSQAVRDALVADPAFKGLADSLAGTGVSQQELIDAITQGGPALDALKAKLAAAEEAGYSMVSPMKFLTTNFSDMRIAGGGVIESLNDQGKAARDGQVTLDELAKSYAKSAADAKTASAAAASAAHSTAQTSAYSTQAGAAAQFLGLSLYTVSRGFEGVLATSDQANWSVQSTSVGFLKASLNVANAAAQLTTNFTQADKAVVSAHQSVDQAQHSLAQSTRSVADAQHSAAQAARSVVDAQQGVADAARQVEQAQRGLDDAYYGVTQAEQAYTRAQQNARDAQQALNEAREQAIQDLKDLRLQMEDQVLSEEQAAVNLFEAQKKAEGAGITSMDQAKDIASADVTAENIEQKKVAFELIAAQNALNNSHNRGVQMREKLSEAEREGVNGAQGVINAQRQLDSANQQVVDSQRALEKAHQQVRDAAYSLESAERGLERAHRQVEDAAYGAMRAHQAVRDAQYQQAQASQQLQQAQLGLRDAQDAASRSLDLNTEAGRRNLTSLLAVWDQIQKTGMPITDQYRQLIDIFASSFGVSRDRAQEFLTQLGLIPKDFKYSITAITQVDTNNFNQWLSGVLKTGGYAMDSRNQQKTVGGTGYATGGQITGWSPTKTADNVPIMATAGEWVHPVDAVEYYGPGFMEAIRTKQFPKGGDGAALMGYARGGVVRAAQDTYAGANLGAGYFATNQAMRVMGFPTLQDLPKWVPPPVDMGGYSGTIPGYKPSAGVAQWTPQTLQAMNMLGLPGAFLPAIQRRMMQESGGNPTIVNDWDSNWRAGHPSVGLMQVIRGTYASYKGPDVGPYLYGVSVDPLSNIYAGLNYAGRVYGPRRGGFANGVLYAMNKPGGYDAGGWLPDGGTGVNSTGKPEAVLNPDESQAFVKLVKSGQFGKATYITINVTAAKFDRAEFAREMKMVEAMNL